MLQTARKPSWIKVRPPGGERYNEIRSQLRTLSLHTVCEEARCPNIGECWNSGTGTFMILGEVCTRGCRFCAVTSGNPEGEVDPAEPENLARAVVAMGLDYVVITTVDRDDLEDGGAAHFAETIRAIRRRRPGVLVEALSGDLQGREMSLQTLLHGEMDVFAHNVETTRRLTPDVRDPRSGYDSSLSLLRRAKEIRPSLVTKSSIMVGLGETKEEVLLTMRDLRSVGVDVLTVGQYLRPSSRHLPVAEFIHPHVFEEYQRQGLAEGFAYVASGPLVRSSYRAGEFFLQSRLQINRSGKSS